METTQRDGSGATNDNLYGGRTCCHAPLRRLRVDEITSEEYLLIRFCGPVGSGIAIRMVGLGTKKVAGMAGGDDDWR
ncbi:unnamed protein product [Trifolium pratense]|uniref:Uncharacterized protein n=1 Tax=Trifolium pratense TaxID=57577 RepID=A0ACB0LRM0_TRIPR|nr:unnamed protein product [Trifolium pratense]